MCRKDTRANKIAVWEGLAFTLVEGLSKTVTTGISQAVTKMSDPLSMLKGIGGGGDSNNNGGRWKGVESNEKPPQEPRDPAFAAAEIVSTYLSTLYTLLTGGEGATVNWKEMGDSGEGGINFIQGSLTSKLENIKFTEASPSTTMKKCINDGLEVAPPSSIS